MLIDANNAIVAAGPTKRSECTDAVFGLLAFMLKDVITTYRKDDGDMQAELDALDAEIKAHNATLDGIKAQLKALRGKTVETDTAKDSINLMLRDSGMRGFSLEPKAGVDNVYEVRRPDGTIADNLSEGEKNFIAFLYKLLRGADFDKKGAVDDNLRVQRFNTLKEKLPDVLDVHSWHEFIKAIMNAGYLSGDLILSGNAIFYTYALYLIAKHRFNASYNENMHLTSLWFFYASLISLYTGSFESTVENHLNTIKNLKTLDEYKEFILSRVNERLTNDYFDITLVGSEGLAVSGRGNNAWNAYVASLNIMNAKILFSKSNLLVSKLFEPGTDGNRKSLEKHHLFPKAYLKSQGYSDAKINQMANYAFIDWKDNMDILDAAPSVYYPIVCAGMSDEQIRVMEDENALPHGWENMPYEDFLIERRKLMAAKIKAAFEILKKAAI